MLACFNVTLSKKAIPIKLVSAKNYDKWLKSQPVPIQNWLIQTHFKPDAGMQRILSDSAGKISEVIVGAGDLSDYWFFGGLPKTLPPGHYFLDITDKDNFREYAIAWGLGAYQFLRYKKSGFPIPQLMLPKMMDVKYILNTVESIYFIRDLINTPTEDMGPTELAQAASHLCKEFQCKLKIITGKELKNNYPCIHTVGRACDDAPRLIDFTWGKKTHLKITLVGKGVCFDTGGLDIKTGSGMLLMKKDMGGAAHVLGLARMIMQANLPINLRVLIPAVENSVSGNSYRPGDIIKSRKGITIEIGNTDAEGRLVLADALAAAVSDKPDLIIDIATLTGAARIALGTELPAVFSNNDAVVGKVIESGLNSWDPMWRLPLFNLYRDALYSSIADINNASQDGYAGAITAALFLKEFVPDNIPWLHFDLMAWNLKNRPGRPQGGEAFAVRALFNYLTACSKKKAID